MYLLKPKNNQDKTASGTSARRFRHGRGILACGGLLCQRCLHFSHHAIAIASRSVVQFAHLQSDSMCNEPKHVHVRHERMLCKFWLEPVALCTNDGFSPVELNRIHAIILKYHDRIQEAWNEHCGE